MPPANSTAGAARAAKRSNKSATKKPYARPASDRQRPQQTRTEKEEQSVVSNLIGGIGSAISGIFSSFWKGATEDQAPVRRSSSTKRQSSHKKGEVKEESRQSDTDSFLAPALAPHYVGHTPYAARRRTDAVSDRSKTSQANDKPTQPKFEFPTQNLRAPVIPAEPSPTFGATTSLTSLTIAPETWARRDAETLEWISSLGLNLQKLANGTERLRNRGGWADKEKFERLMKDDEGFFERQGLRQRAAPETMELRTHSRTPSLRPTPYQNPKHGHQRQISLADPRLQLDPAKWPRNTTAGILAAWREICRRQELIAAEEAEQDQVKFSQFGGEDNGSAEARGDGERPAAQGQMERGMTLIHENVRFPRGKTSTPASSKGAAAQEYDEDKKNKKKEKKEKKDVKIDHQKMEDGEQQTAETQEEEQKTKEKEPDAPMKDTEVQTEDKAEDKAEAAPEASMEDAPVANEAEAPATDNKKRAASPSFDLPSPKHTGVVIPKERRRRAGCFSALDEDLDEMFGPEPELPAKKKIKPSINVGAETPLKRTVEESGFTPRVPLLRDDPAVEEANKKATAARFSSFGAAAAALPKEGPPKLAEKPAETTAPTFSFGNAEKKAEAEAPKPATAPSFNFGGASVVADKPTGEPKKDTAPSFSFGKPEEKKVDAPAAAAAATFSFGKPAEEKKDEVLKPAAAAPSFSFGAPKMDAAPAAPNTASTTPTFAFGGAAVAPAAEKKDAPAAAPVPTFSFGAASKSAEDKPAAPAASSFAFGAPVPKPAEEPKKDNSPAFGFGAPVVAPAESTNKRSADSDEPAAKKSTGGFSFSNTSTISPFGAVNGVGTADAAKPSPFAFGAPKTDAAPAAASTTPTFAFGSTAAAKSEEKKDAAPAAGGLFGASTAAPAAGAFNFGAAPAAAPAKPAAAAPSFSFGAPAATSATEAPKPAAGGFNFGAPAAAAPATDAAKPLIFGSSTTTVADSKPASGLFGSTTTAGTGGSTLFGSTAAPGAEAPKPAFGGFGSTTSAAPASTGGFAGFGQSNTAPAPAAAPASGGSFTFGSNTGSTTPAFGATNSAPATNVFGQSTTAAPAAPAATGGFGFGANNNNALAAGGFNFGANNAAPGTPVVQAAGFNFNAPGSPAPVPAATGFGFGNNAAPQSPAPAAAQPFAFGTPASAPANGGFQFGAGTPAQPQQPQTPGGGSMFQFGGPNTPGTPGAGAAPGGGNLFSVGSAGPQDQQSGRKIAPARGRLRRK
ncbi:hypothetical protein YB2330_003164 [Saitoella coloradoensis]